MLNDIVLLIVGGIGGVIGKKGIQTAVQALVPTPPTPTPSPAVSAPPAPAYAPATVANTWSSTGSAPNWLNFQNPELDETWTPPPPPTTPPTLLESDTDREQLAAARAGER